jgi:hypothetical protein
VKVVHSIKKPIYDCWCIDILPSYTFEVLFKQDPGGSCRSTPIRQLLSLTWVIGTCISAMLFVKSFSCSKISKMFCILIWEALEFIVHLYQTALHHSCLLSSIICTQDEPHHRGSTHTPCASFCCSSSYCEVHVCMCVCARALVSWGWCVCVCVGGGGVFFYIFLVEPWCFP